LLLIRKIDVVGDWVGIEILVSAERALFVAEKDVQITWVECNIRVTTVCLEGVDTGGSERDKILVDSDGLGRWADILFDGAAAHVKRLGSEMHHGAAAAGISALDGARGHWAELSDLNELVFIEPCSVRELFICRRAVHIVVNYGFKNTCGISLAAAYRGSISLCDVSILAEDVPAPDAGTALKRRRVIDFKCIEGHAFESFKTLKEANCSGIDDNDGN